MPGEANLYTAYQPLNRTASAVLEDNGPANMESTIVAQRGSWIVLSGESHLCDESEIVSPSVPGNSMDERLHQAKPALECIESRLSDIKETLATLRTKTNESLGDKGVVEVVLEERSEGMDELSQRQPQHSEPTVPIPTTFELHYGRRLVERARLPGRNF